MNVTPSRPEHPKMRGVTYLPAFDRRHRARVDPEPQVAPRPAPGALPECCPVCGKQFKSRRTPLGPQQHCSQRCYGLSRRGPKHHRWSTGRYAKPIPTQIEQISQLHKRHARRHRTGREVGRVEVQETRANTGRLCVSSSSTGSSQS